LVSPGWIVNLSSIGEIEGLQVECEHPFAKTAVAAVQGIDEVREEGGSVGRVWMDTPDVADVIGLHADDEISPLRIAVRQLVASVLAERRAFQAIEANDRVLGSTAHGLAFNGVSASGHHINRQPLGLS
jgi:hypothetical protein